MLPALSRVGKKQFLPNNILNNISFYLYLVNYIDLPKRFGTYFFMLYKNANVIRLKLQREIYLLGRTNPFKSRHNF